MPTITLVSDTHGSHHELGRLKPCDLLVHCGDCTSDGGLASLRDFLRWFEAQPAPEKVLVVGNHDWIFEKEPGVARTLVAELAPSARYLQDHGELIAGINVWGSPYQPEFNNWAFNVPRGEEIKKHWDRIPHGVDLLITHGPPHGILDKSKSPGHDDNLGCEELLKCVNRIKPKVHCFGHIHGSYGLQMKDGTLFANASVMNEQYLITNSPITINL
jgi:predicted phosphodiesterase